MASEFEFHGSAIPEPSAGAAIVLLMAACFAELEKLSNRLTSLSAHFSNQTWEYGQ